MNSGRRKAISWLGTALLLPGLGSGTVRAEPVLAGIARIELAVSDLASSMTFYGRLFGVEAWQLSPDGRAWLSLGGAHLVLRQAGTAGIGRAVFAVADFDAEALQAYLVSQRLRPNRDDDGLLWVQDGDCIVSALTGRQAPGVALSPAPRQDTGQDLVFAPLVFDEVHLMVSNLEVDSLFYSRLLGRTASQQAGSLWYDLGQGRLRLSQTPPGQSAGVNYFSVLVANTDMALASERVFAAGGLVENLLPNGFSFWDPDGMRVLVRATTQH